MSHVTVSDAYSARLLDGMGSHIEIFHAGFGDLLEKPQFNDDAIRILNERYFIKDDNGNVIETPELFLARVALGVQYPEMSKPTIIHPITGDSSEPDFESVYATAVEYYNIMARLDFLPGSPTLMNAGTRMGQLSACFVIPVEDSMTSIMDAVKAVALVHQSGGGTGMDFSSLRPAGALVGSTQGVASGPISFMKVFDATTEQIKQGGKRRGANMGMLRVDHPDILEFISCKDDDKSLQNFNISVAVTDEFMDALDGNGAGMGDSSYEYDLIDPKTGIPCGRFDAREVWSQLVEHAWRTGDPGIIFIDRVNEMSPFDVDRYPAHEMVATNPCGEQPLEAYEACNLGSINLKNFVIQDGDVAAWDFDRLKSTIPLCVQMLDDVVTASVFPLPEITEKVRRNRKIGFGVMGFADALIQMKVAYGSEQSLDIAREIMELVNDEAHKASCNLAENRGNFITFPDSKLAHVYGRMRNATCTTIAPTGTISMLANGTSSGIEPVFSFAFTKKVMDGKKFYYVHPEVQRLLDAGELEQEDVDILLEDGHFDKHVLKFFPYLAGAMDITPEQHVRMQAAFQEHVDNAVSKTVNLPNSATIEDVDAIYRLAYETGCKGTTIYRDGSKSDQVLFTGSKSENKNDDIDATVAIIVKDEEAFELVTDALENPENYEIIKKGELDELLAMQDRSVRPRPEVMLGMTVKVDTPCGHLYVTISEDEDGQPFEIFCKLGKSGACAGAVQESLGRLISQDLRSGGDVNRIVKQLRGASCGQSVGFGPKRVTSCIDAIGQVLQRYTEGDFHSQVIHHAEDEVEDLAPELEPVDKPVDLPNGPGAMLVNDGPQGLEIKHTPQAPVRRNGACPECGSPMEHEGGCAVCRACGFSKCA